SSLLPCFFVILRGPPGCTLFPYTTLFRSRRVLTEDHPRQVVPEPDGQCDPVPRISQGVPMAVDLPDMWQQVEGDGQLAAPDVGEDRKSTRLNSSHVKISYAVFCLKKKNDK